MVEDLKPGDGKGPNRRVTAVWHGLVTSVEGDTAVADLVDATDNGKPDRTGVTFNAGSIPRSELSKVGRARLEPGVVFSRTTIREIGPAGGHSRHQFEVIVPEPLGERDIAEGRRIAARVMQESTTPPVSDTLGEKP